MDQPKAQGFVRDLPDIKSAEYPVKLQRRCLPCGAIITISIRNAAGYYRGGHFFGEHHLPGTGKLRKKLKAQGVQSEVLDHLNEYWECQECFKGEQRGRLMRGRQQ